MAKIAEETDSLHRLIQEAVQNAKEDFDESEILYTIQMLQAGLQDIVEDVQGLKRYAEGIEKDTESIKQRLHECSQLVNKTTA